MIDIRKLLNIDLPIVLASKSPRREKLLSNLGLEFAVIPSGYDERNCNPELPPEEYASSLAFEKAKFVAASLSHPCIVIGADTIVVLDGAILNKPRSNDEAFRMLRQLSNRTHTVFTGVSVINSITGKCLTDVKSTEVTFRELSDLEINEYIKTGSPIDKAGAYGIQDDFGAVFVSHVNGCYYNIVGLPLEMLYSLLSNFGE